MLLQEQYEPSEKQEVHMYIELVRDILLGHVEKYASDNNRTKVEVLTQIREQMDSTSSEYWSEQPSIEYENPLCRLGYLYRHVTANATLFEHVLDIADEVSSKIRAAAGDVLNVCALGGGPGTELLGLAKYMLRRHHRPMPRRLNFAVLDNVPQWAETWTPLADAVESQLASQGDQGGQQPTIVPSFQTMDVLDASSYASYAFQFSRADIVVYNYLFSENKSQLGDAEPAIQRLAELTRPGCKFVVIDRLEGDPQFSDDVMELFNSVFDDDIQSTTHNGVLAADEQIEDLGDELLDILGKPRMTFFRDYEKRIPTVFWFVAERGESE